MANFGITDKISQLRGRSTISSALQSAQPYASLAQAALSSISSSLSSSQQLNNSNLDSTTAEKMQQQTSHQTTIASNIINVALSALAAFL